MRRYDAEQPVFLVQHGDGVLGIVLDARQRVYNALVRVNVGVGGRDQLRERVALARDDEVFEIDRAVESVVGIHNIDRGDVVVLGGLLDELVHCGFDAQPLGDDDAVRRHNAADLVLAVDPEPRDLAALRLVHELDERVFLTAFECFEVVHRSVGVHAREHVHPPPEAQFIEIRRHRLGVFEHGRELRGVKRVVDPLPLGGGERFERGGDVVFVIVEQLLAERLRREIAADELRQLPVVIRVAELHEFGFVFHVSALRFNDFLITAPEQGKKISPLPGVRRTSIRAMVSSGKERLHRPARPYEVPGMRLAMPHIRPLLPLSMVVPPFKIRYILYITHGKRLCQGKKPPVRFSDRRQLFCGFFRNYSMRPLSLSSSSTSVPRIFLSTIFMSSRSPKFSSASERGFLSMA